MSVLGFCNKFKAQLKSIFRDCVITTLFITANDMGPKMDHLLFLELDFQVWCPNKRVGVVELFLNWLKRL